MPQTSIPAGVPTVLVQNQVYALPSSRVFLTSTAALEFSNIVDSGFAAVTASTTGIETGFAFCRCTTGTPTVMVRKA